MEPSLAGGMKVCLPHLGHMIKIATMPIYGKNLLKIFFSRIKGPMAWGLVCSIGDMGPMKFEKSDDLELTLTFFMERSFFYIDSYRQNFLIFFLSETRKPRPLIFVV